MKKSNRKKIVLVDRELQFRLSLFGALVGLVSSAIGVALIIYPLYIFEVIRFGNFLPLPVFLVIGFSILINSGFVVLFGIHVTHKIAGPVYGLVRKLREVEKGNWSQTMRSREGDELKFLIRNYNNMIEGLKHQAKVDINELKSIRQMLEAKGDVSSPKNSEKADGNPLSKVDDLIKKMESKINSRSS